jgi:hypothetical protein
VQVLLEDTTILLHRKREETKKPHSDQVVETVVRAHRAPQGTARLLQHMWGLAALEVYTGQALGSWFGALRIITAYHSLEGVSSSKAAT